MILNKRIHLIVAVAVVFALIFSGVLVVIGNTQAETGGIASEPEYATKIFGTEIISIEIIADSADWQEMLDNAINEEYIMADVVVNGTKFQNVGVRPKGNSSLTQVASSDSDRYSFRLQFDEYIKGQTCFGLDSFVVNNMLGDNTYMKEYVSYELMKEIGVDAPYFGYADIKVNGESWGLYLAVELYNDSYEQRVYGDTAGMLYNVKSMDMGGNAEENLSLPSNMDGSMPENMPGNMGGNMPGNMGGNMPGNMPGNMGGNIPGNMDGNMPGNMPGDANGNMSGSMPGDTDGNMSGNTDSNMPGNMPGDTNGNMSGSMPGDTDGNMSGNADSNMPGNADSNMPGNMPGDANGGMSGNVPGDTNSSMNGNTDGNVDGNVSGNTDGNMSGVVPGQQGENTLPSLPIQPDDIFSSIGGNNRSKGGFGSSGGSLEYTDDNVESYSAIFNNVVGKGTEKDYQRVVQAIKALSEGKELEDYFDVDQILRYLAAHTIVVNLDSYSSSMAQNYFIYENDGKVTILPWDYNLAWGGYQSGSASSVINFPIDTPVSGVEMSSRPLFEKLFANEEYLERYHSYLQQLMDTYFANGKFEEKINTLDALISDYVKNDATAFCTYEEYQTAISTFITLGNLRAQSVQGQLDGSVPSTTEEQDTNADQLISSGDLTLSDLGSMMGGKGGDSMTFPGRVSGQDNNMFSGDIINGLDSELMSKVFDIMRQTNGEITEEVKEELTSLGLTEEQVEQLSSIVGGQIGGLLQNGDNSTSSNGMGKMEQLGQDKNLLNPFMANAPTGQRMEIKNYILVGALSFVLIGAILFAAKYKKRY